MGVGTIVCACTELPLIDVNVPASLTLLDPTLLLAKALLAPVEGEGKA
jgi:aspartate/glutamate racemase